MYPNTPVVERDDDDGGEDGIGPVLPRVVRTLVLSRSGRVSGWTPLDVDDLSDMITCSICGSLIVKVSRDGGNKKISRGLQNLP